MKYQSVIDFVKFTAVLPIALMVYCIEKLGPIRDKISLYSFEIIILLLIVSIASGLYALMSLTSAVSNKDNPTDLAINNQSIKISGTTHLISLILGSILLFGVVIYYLDDIYKKEEQSKKVEPIVCVLEVES